MDPSQIFTLNVEKLSQLAPDLPREVVRVAILFDGKRKLWEVLRDSFLTSRMTLSVFGRLTALDILVALPSEPCHKPDSSQAQEEAPVQAPQIVSTMKLPAPSSSSEPRPQAARPQAAPEPRPQAAQVAPVAAEDGSLGQVEQPTLPSQPAASAPVRPVAAAEDFDEADRAFFDSYEPEDSTVDTFWDLEEVPRKRRAGRLRQRRLNRRGRGWLAQLLLS